MNNRDGKGASGVSLPAEEPRLDHDRVEFLLLVFDENREPLARFIASLSKARPIEERDDVALELLAYIYLAAAMDIARLPRGIALPGPGPAERQVWLFGIARSILHQHFRLQYPWDQSPPGGDHVRWSVPAGPVGGSGHSDSAWKFELNQARSEGWESLNAQRSSNKLESKGVRKGGDHCIR